MSYVRIPSVAFLHIEGLGDYANVVALTHEDDGVAAFILKLTRCALDGGVDIVVGTLHQSKVISTIIINNGFVGTCNINIVTSPCDVLCGNGYTSISQGTGQNSPIIAYTSYMEFFISVRALIYWMSIALT